MPQQTIAAPGTSEDPYQTPQNSSNSNAGNASLSAQLVAVVGKTNYCTGYGFSASGATTGQLVDVIVTGLIGGTRHHVYGIPTGATLSGGVVYVPLNPPVPATAQNLQVQVNMPAAGVGNVQQCVQIDGYAQ